MGFLLQGALGAISGGAGAVETLSDEKRKALAEKLKMDALEQMNMRMSKFEHGLRMEEQTVNQGFLSREATKGRDLTTTQNYLGRQSDKELNDARLQVQKDIALQDDKYKTADLDRKDKANILKEREILNKAQIEINDVFEKQGLTDEAIEVVNGLLETANAPFRYTLAGESGKVRWLRKDVQSTQKLTRVPFAGATDATGKGTLAGKSDGPGSSDLKALLDKANSVGDSKTPAVKGVEVPGKTGVDPRGEGMLQGRKQKEMGDLKRDPLLDLGDPEKWSVINIEPHYYIKVPKTPENPKGLVQMSPAEIEEWKKTKKGQEIFGSPAGYIRQ